MIKEGRKPELIIIAGPNGSGKTSVTKRFLHHEWAEGTTYINPDEVANEMFGDWNSREAVFECSKQSINDVYEILVSLIFQERGKYTNSGRSKQSEKAS